MLIKNQKNDGNKTCLLVKLTQYLGRRTSYQQSDLVIVSWLCVALLLQDPDDLLWIMKPWILLSTRKSRRRISGLQFMPWSLRARQWFKIQFKKINKWKKPSTTNKISLFPAIMPLIYKQASSTEKNPPLLYRNAIADGHASICRKVNSKSYCREAESVKGC